jgi:signal transduction protein with GAF and PtsI domain
METDRVPARRFDLDQFKSISHAISTYEDLSLLTKHLAEGTAKSFKAKGCSIMLLDEREKQLFHINSYGLSDEYLRKGPVIVDEKFCAFCVGEPIFIKNMMDDSRVQYPKAAQKEGIISMLSVPIKYRQDVIGIIRIYRTNSSPYHEEDVDSLWVLGEQLGLVIEINGLRNFLDSVKMALENLPLRMLEGL